MTQNDKWGTARVEFIAVSHDVESMLKKGHSKIGIYRFLFDNGKISMKYTTFWRLIDKFFKEYVKKAKAKPRQDNENIEAKGQVISQKNICSDRTNGKPRIIGINKPKPFGEDVIDLADIYGTKTE